jgi:methionine-gamma-lyase
VLLETPANPTLIMTDIERAAESAAGHPDKPVVMVDNTFLGPAFQHPLLWGADVSLYSGTKYLSGFSDMLAGVALTKSSDLIQKIRSRRNMFGSILQPDECWTLNSRLPTVALRMNRQSKNAQRLAEALHGHNRLSDVIYPTLFQDPEQKRIFEKQCDHPGGLFSVEFKGGKAGGLRLPAAPAHRQERRIAGRSGNAHLPSEEHHAFRDDRRGAGRIGRDRRTGAHLRGH